MARNQFNYRLSEKNTGFMTPAVAIFVELDR
jgi:hypothetical protein